MLLRATILKFRTLSNNVLLIHSKQFSIPILVSPDTWILFFIKVDNLDFDIKAVLSQVSMNDGK